VTDSPDEAVERIADVVQKNFGFMWRPKLRRRWFLGEG
jgi:hypothetical protein